MVFGAFFSKIKQGLAKTRSVFGSVAALFRLQGRVDRDFLAELEKRLYLADVGTGATAEIVERVRQAFLDKEITGDIETFVKQQLKEMVTVEGADGTGAGATGRVAQLRYAATGPTVI